MRTQRENDYYTKLRKAINAEADEIRNIPVKERDDFLRGMWLAYSIVLKTMTDVKEDLDEEP